MRIFGLMLVKNEADIVGECLLDALRWCECVSVLDNASTDGTWAIVQSLAYRYPGRIDLAGVYDGLYHNDLRMIAFRRLRARATTQDWWCRLDADEMYAEDPRDFLARLPATECRVNAVHVFYEYTDQDLAAWEVGAETLRDRERSIRERRRYYRATYQELRFMRHHPRLRWCDGEPWPVPRGPLSNRLIPMQHFRARDPIQLRERFAVRKPVAEAAQRKANHHWRVAADDWQTHVVAAAECRYDCRDGPLQIDWRRFRQPWSKRVGQVLRRVAMALGVRL